MQTLELGRRRPDLRRAALRAVLANLFRAYEAGKPVAISRDKNEYTNLGRYLAEYCTYSIVISVVDSLIQSGWVHTKLGYYFNEERKARCSRIWATEQLIDLFKKYLGGFFFPVPQVECHSGGSPSRGQRIKSIPVKKFDF